LGEARRVRGGDVGGVELEQHTVVAEDLAVLEFVEGGVAVPAEEGGGDPVGAVDALEV